MFENFAAAELVGFLVSVGGVVVSFGVIVFAILFAIRSSAPAQVRGRLQRIAEGQGGEIHTPVRHATKNDEETGWMRYLRPLAKMAKGDRPDQSNRIQEQLAHAGFRGSHIMEAYLAIRLVTALFTGAMAFVVNAFHHMPAGKLALLCIVGVLVGFNLPAALLQRRIDNRQKELSNAMSDTLDLLVAIVEAGISLEQALERVSREVGTSSSLLAEELQQTVSEIEAGLPRAEAFRRLASRTGLADMRSLAGIFIQTEMFGTSVGKALRVLADSLRTQRMQRAQERAATISTKLTIPLVTCMLPSMMLVLMGGAVIQIIGVLMPTMKGQ